MGEGAARICCLDLDTFFVSVERLLDPSLVGKPVIVGGRPGQRGVVTAASYEVRALGVHSGMSMVEAYRRAPDAIYLSTRHGEYGDHAEKVRQLAERFTPIVRTASIDEFFLDFHGCEALYRRPEDRDDDAAIERTVRRMRDRIQDELGLPASAGIGATRHVAKIASGRAKPAGVLMVRAGTELAFLNPLPVRRYPGIGPVAEASLVRAGIETLGHLLDLPPGPLRDRFGKLADSVRRGALVATTTRVGRDRPAFREHDPDGLTVGSISNERTFHADVSDARTVRDQLRALSERVCWRARKRDVVARTVTLKLRYSDFETLNRSRTIPATNADASVYRCVLDLLRRAHTRKLPVRLLGVALSGLAPAHSQLPLPLGGARQGDVGVAMDAVRTRFGFDAIRRGATDKTSKGR